ncbi:uncharacterized protein LOC118807457 [Colossoma macropomum]|uniref:uncharacterized protein LOC118807457 n=1 Tax=Colossoma macropomum TaxID=42526 RepID=UPI0018642F0A|nr:uncharacterized protein LOC118807457 [Colossoma macropomum]
MIEDGGPADLYCNASGGYPAGAIHWFDSTNTNWTKSATLEIREREDKLVHLSSKLTFAKIDLSWESFRCVVLNSKFVQEGETTSHLNIRAKYNPPSISSWPEKIEEGGPAELNCIVVAIQQEPFTGLTAQTPTGRRTPHWRSQREDKLVHLSSKLTFTSISLSRAPFKCVVLNSKFIQEESTFHLKFTGDKGHSDHSGTKWGSITAGLLVIGLIIVGLLFALLYRRRPPKYQQHPERMTVTRCSPRMPQIGK